MHALAPAGCTPEQSNRLFNQFITDPAKGLVLFHDHFIGAPGGVAVFFIESPEEREAIMTAGPLIDWTIDVRPLIFSHSPAAFDEQIRYTLEAYRDADWEVLRREQRPRYGDPARETATGEED